VSHYQAIPNLPCILATMLRKLGSDSGVMQPCRIIKSTMTMNQEQVSLAEHWHGSYCLPRAQLGLNKALSILLVTSFKASSLNYCISRVSSSMDNHRMSEPQKNPPPHPVVPEWVELYLAAPPSRMCTGLLVEVRHTCSCGVQVNLSGAYAVVMYQLGGNLGKPTH
jgi:hypothetical protein